RRPVLDLPRRLDRRRLRRPGRRPRRLPRREPLAVAVLARGLRLSGVPDRLHLQSVCSLAGAVFGVAPGRFGEVFGAPGGVQELAPVVRLDLRALRVGELDPVPPGEDARVLLGRLGFVLRLRLFRLLYQVFVAESLGPEASLLDPEPQLLDAEASLLGG